MSGTYGRTLRLYPLNVQEAGKELYTDLMGGLYVECGGCGGMSPAHHESPLYKKYEVRLR